jgi:hypothetical protein
LRGLIPVLTIGSFLATASEEEETSLAEFLRAVFLRAVEKSFVLISEPAPTPPTTANDTIRHDSEKGGTI